MKEHFLKLYDNKIDEIFLYSFEQTHDRELSKIVAERTFTHAWNYLNQGHSINEAETKLLNFAATFIEQERQLHHLHAPQFMPILKMT